MAAKRMDAVALLKADHREVEALFEKFKKARRAAQKRTLVERICSELSVHATIEEEIFYPACLGEVEEDLLDEAYVEHDGAKVLIGELAKSEPGAPFYDAKVTVLSEMIKHHVEEEEKRAEGLFAQAKSAGVDVDALGVRMSARKKELLARIKADGVPSPTTRSFSGHELEQGAPIA